MITRCAACNHATQITVTTHWAPAGQVTQVAFELCPLCAERLAQAHTWVEKRLLKLVEMRLLLGDPTS
jgi:hypothetical protein